MTFASFLRSEWISVWKSLVGYFQSAIASVDKNSHRRCSVEKVFLKISQNSQENTCAPDSGNFAKFLRTPFLQNNSGQLLLNGTGQLFFQYSTGWLVFKPSTWVKPAPFLKGLAHLYKHFAISSPLLTCIIIPHLNVRSQNIEAGTLKECEEEFFKF